MTVEKAQQFIIITVMERAGMGMKGLCIILINVIYDKPIANIILHGEQDRIFNKIWKKTMVFSLNSYSMYCLKLEKYRK